MLSLLIQFSLRHRVIILLAACILLALGIQIGRTLPVEVLPDLTKPTVTILTEAPGLAPEEVEARVTTRALRVAVLASDGHDEKCRKQR